MLKKILWGTAGLVALAACAAFVFGPGYLESGLNRVVPHDPYEISDEARSLHATLALAELHSDTLLWDRDVLDRASRGHVGLQRSTHVCTRIVVRHCDVGEHRRLVACVHQVLPVHR